MARRKYGARVLTGTERRQLHDRRKRRRAMVDDFNTIVSLLSRLDMDRFEASGILPKPFLAALRDQMRLVKEQSEQNLHYWQIATGERRDGLFPYELLALQAWRWDWLERREQPERWPNLPEEDRRPYCIDGGWVESEGEDGRSKQRIISWPSWLRDQFTAENLRDDGGSHWYEAASLWGLRKALGRHRPTTKIKFADGSHKGVPTAWAAGPPQLIPVRPELKKLYRGALVWEWLRWRFRPPDLTDDTWDTARLIGPPGGSKNRAAWKLPVPALSVGNASLASFAPIYAWAHSVAQRARQQEPFNWDGIGLDTPEHFTSSIGREADDEDDGIPTEEGIFEPGSPDVVVEFFTDRAVAVHRRGQPTAITLGKAFVIGHYQRSPGWAAKCEPAQTFEPLDYNLTRRLDLLDRVREATGKHLPRLVGKQSKRYWAGVKGRPVRPFWWSSRLVRKRLTDDDALDRLATSAAIEAWALNLFVHHSRF